MTHMAHLSLWLPVHTHVEMAGHNGHAPEVPGQSNVRMVGKASLSLGF